MSAWQLFDGGQHGAVCATARQLAGGNGAITQGRGKRDTDMQGESVALIAAGQGDLREALCAMLHSMSGVTVVEVDDTMSAIAALSHYHPQVVVIDSALPGNHSMELIRAIQEQRPRVRCAILVDTIGQQAAAMRAGADRAPMKGEPATRLFFQVEQLIAGAQKVAA